MATAELDRVREVPLMSGAEVMCELLKKADRVLKGKEREALLVNNLFPDDTVGAVCWEVDTFYQTKEGFKRPNASVLREGVLLLAKELGCNLSDEVQPQCSTASFHGSPYLVEKRIFPTNMEGVSLVRKCWFDGRNGGEGKFEKEQLWIKRA